MLVLSRRANEEIVFPTLGVTLKVCSIKGNQVRLGIDAPPSVPILRQELSAGTKEIAVPEGKAERHKTRNRLTFFFGLDLN